MTDTPTELAANETYICPCESQCGGIQGYRLPDRIGPSFLTVQHWQDRCRIVQRWPEMDNCLHTFPIIKHLLFRILPDTDSPEWRKRLGRVSSDYATGTDPSSINITLGDGQALTMRTIYEDDTTGLASRGNAKTDSCTSTLFLHPELAKIACRGQGKKDALSQRSAKLHLLLILISGRVKVPKEIQDNIDKLDLPPPPPNAPPEPIGSRPEFMPSNDMDLFTTTRHRNKYAKEIEELGKLGININRHSPIFLLKQLRISFPFLDFSTNGRDLWMVKVVTPHVVCCGQGNEVVNALEAALFQLVILAVQGLEPSALDDIKAGKVAIDFVPELDTDTMVNGRLRDFGQRPNHRGSPNRSRSASRSVSRDRYRRRSRTRSPSASRPSRAGRRDRERQRERDRRSRSRSRSRSREHRRGGGGGRGGDRDRGWSPSPPPASSRSSRRGRSRSRTVSRERARQRSGSRGRGYGGDKRKRRASPSRSPPPPPPADRRRGGDRDRDRKGARPTRDVSPPPHSSSRQQQDQPFSPAASRPVSARHLPLETNGVSRPSSAYSANAGAELSVLPTEMRAIMARHPMVSMWAADPVSAMCMWVWKETGKDLAGHGNPVQINRTVDGSFVIASVRLPGGTEVQEVATEERLAVAKATARVILGDA